MSTTQSPKQSPGLSAKPFPIQSPIQSPSETGGAVLNEMKPLPITESVVEDRDLEDRDHEEPQSGSSPTSGAESSSKDEEERQKTSHPIKEVAPWEEPIRKMTGESIAGQTTPQEISKPDHQSLLSYTDKLKKELEEKSQDLISSRTEREELVEVLNNLRTKYQPVGRLNDGEVIEYATQLEYNIFNLSQQWPEGSPLKTTPIDDKYLRYLQSTTPESSSYRRLLEDSDRRPQVIEAFIWRVLTTEVFGLFHWAGESVAPRIGGLKKFLAATSELDSPRPSDIQMWTSKTTQLLLEAFSARGYDEKQQASVYLERLKSGITTPIIETLGLPLNSKEGIVRQLSDILDGAIDLDKRFSQQVARWEWQYPYESNYEGRLVFDEDSMSLDQGESISSKKRGQRVVRVVISPVLIKRGDDDGENYNLEMIGKKMTVSCKGI